MTHPSVDPSTGVLTRGFEHASSVQVDEALSAADRCFQAWRAVRGFERADIQASQAADGGEPMGRPAGMNVRHRTDALLGLRDAEPVFHLLEVFRTCAHLPAPAPVVQCSEASVSVVPDGEAAMLVRAYLDGRAMEDWLFDAAVWMAEKRLAGGLSPVLDQRLRKDIDSQATPTPSSSAMPQPGTIQVAMRGGADRCA